MCFFVALFFPKKTKLFLYRSFPPRLLTHLAGMWNRSVSPYLICHHGPPEIIDFYEFHVEKVTQLPTSMHGSKEKHTGYIYKRKLNTDARTQKLHQQKEPPSSLPLPAATQSLLVPCDPYYKNDIDVVQSGFSTLKQVISRHMNNICPDNPTSKSLRSHCKTTSATATASVTIC